jgi:hypothetical protein
MDNFPQGISHEGIDQFEEREEREPEEVDTQIINEND